MPDKPVSKDRELERIGVAIDRSLLDKFDELIARHPRFPRPVPLGMQGRRWRPADVVAWIDELCGAPGTPSGPIAGTPGAAGSIAASKVPAFDISILTSELQRGTHA